MRDVTGGCAGGSRECSGMRDGLRWESGMCRDELWMGWGLGKVPRRDWEMRWHEECDGMRLAPGWGREDAAGWGWESPGEVGLVNFQGRGALGRDSLSTGTGARDARRALGGAGRAGLCGRAGHWEGQGEGEGTGRGLVRALWDAPSPFASALGGGGCNRRQEEEGGGLQSCPHLPLIPCCPQAGGRDTEA